MGLRLVCRLSMFADVKYCLLVEKYIFLQYYMIRSAVTIFITIIVYIAKKHGILLGMYVEYINE